QRAGDRHALLHAARQLVGIGAGEALEVDQAQEAARRLGALGGARPAHLQPELHVALRGPPREELGEILEDDAAVEPMAGDDAAADADLAARRREEAGDQVQQRGLAAAAAPDETEELGGAGVHRHLARRRHRPRRARVLVADLGDLDVAHQAEVPRTRPQRSTVRRSSAAKTRRSTPRPSRPMTARLPSITSVLRNSFESKITHPRPQRVAAIISPPTTAIQPRANACRRPALTNGRAPGSTTWRKIAPEPAPIDSAARIQSRLTEHTPVHVFRISGKSAA